MKEFKLGEELLILLELRIKRISIQNFKGIKSFELSPDGYSINIYGDNRTGKNHDI